MFPGRPLFRVIFAMCLSLGMYQGYGYAGIMSAAPGLESTAGHHGVSLHAALESPPADSMRAISPLEWLVADIRELLADLAFLCPPPSSSGAANGNAYAGAGKLPVASLLAVLAHFEPPRLCSDGLPLAASLAPQACVNELLRPPERRLRPVRFCTVY